MDKKKKVYEKLQKTAEIMEQLLEIALADGVVSAEEKPILHSVNDHLQQYVRLIIDNLEQGVPNQAEIKKIEQSLLLQTKKFAEMDAQISEDELKLLEALNSMVGELYFLSKQE